MPRDAVSRTANVGTVRKNGLKLTLNVYRLPEFISRVFLNIQNPKFCMRIFRNCVKKIRFIILETAVFSIFVSWKIFSLKI